MTPDDLRVHLTQHLLATQPTLDKMAGLYDGTLPLAYIDPEVLRTMKGRIKPVSCNLARLAADAVVQRLTISGFRTGPDDVADDDLAQLWRRTKMPSTSALTMLDATVLGRGFLMVWAGADGRPVITAESPTTTVVQRDPITREVTAALKRWRAMDGATHTIVITPDVIREYVSAMVAPSDPLIAFDFPMGGEDAALVREDPNTLGLVPVVPVVNRPMTTAPDGASDLLELLDPVSALSKLSSDMMTGSEAAAIPRRYVATPSVMTEEQAREVQEGIIKSLMSPGGTKVSVLGGGATLNELTASDLAGFRTGIELLIDEVAALASLPGYWVRSATSNPTSADAIRAAEHRLSVKVRQRQEWFGPAFADAMRLAQLVRDGYADPRLDDLVTMWADPSPRTISQEADAATRLFATGVVDRRGALELMQFPPLEVERQLASTIPDPSITII